MIYAILQTTLCFYVRALYICSTNRGLLKSGLVTLATTLYIALALPYCELSLEEESKEGR